MLTPTQAFIKLLIFFAVMEGILVAVIGYIFSISRDQFIGLVVAAVIMFLVFAIRTWNNPELHR